MAVKVIRKFRLLFDVLWGSPNDGDIVIYDAGIDKLVLAPPAAASGAAPDDATYLVGTASGELSSEIVVGQTPGGELGGTWATPTVDAVHSGSSHAAVQAAAEATAAAALAGHTGDTTDAHDASAISVTPAGGIAADDVQEALEELDTEKAAAVHTHAGEDITSGTVADARIASTIARDSEVTAAISASEAGQVRDGDAAGGVLSGTYPNPGFAVDMATQAELDAHTGDATDAHDASAISFVPNGSIAATNVQDAIVEVRDEAAGGGAPSTADYLVGTAQGGLSAEIVVGTSPGGELGGTWAAPTVDAVHSGSSHADVQAAAEATAAAALTAHINDPTDAHDASAISIADAGGDFTATDVEGALAELQADHEADVQALADHLADGSGAHAASAVSYAGGTGMSATDVEGAIDELATEKANTADAVMDGDAAGGVLSGTYPNPGFAADMATQAELDAHLNDTVDAHDASAITVADAGGLLTATEVEGALAEIATKIRAGRLFLSAAGMWPSTTAGAGTNTKKEYSTNDQNLYNLPFDAATEEYAEATVAMPSDWDGGTFTAQFYWSKDGTGTGDVIWGCQGRSYGDGEAIDQAWGTAQTVTDAASATDDAVHISSATGAITLSGTPAAGELVQFRVYRDADAGGDTFAGDALLLGVMISYTRT